MSAKTKPDRNRRRIFDDPEKVLNGKKPRAAREVVQQSKGVKTIRNLGIRRCRLLIGTPTLGVIRMEWAMARRSLVIPVNFTSGEIIAPCEKESVVAIGYSTADAQNVICEQVVNDTFDWLVFIEDDVILPHDTLIRLSEYMENEDIPIVSGLYFTKGNPSVPLLFRGRGNSIYRNWKMGDRVWVDGIPTGIILIHSSIIKYLWNHSDDYRLPDGTTVKEIFKFPRDVWIDPETNSYLSRIGTSDLYFCDRVMNEKVFEKTGWKKVAGKRYPFVCDTRLFCNHCDLNTGAMYPGAAQMVFGPLK